jgi:peptidoglycan/LPS O-acetylase OafA/YrhL
LPYLISLFLVIGVSSNFIFTSKNWWVEIFTPACFDAFAIGGSLSFLTSYRQDLIQNAQNIYKWLAGSILLIFILDVLGYSFLPPRTVHALFAVTIIYYCLFKDNNKIINAVLRNKWLIKLGKISYGVYLYHLFVPELWLWINEKLYNSGLDPFFNKQMPAIIQPYWLFVQEFSFLLILCVLSWRLIEQPINKLKNRFNDKSKEGGGVVELKDMNAEVANF